MSNATGEAEIEIDLNAKDAISQEKSIASFAPLAFRFKKTSAISEAK